MKYVFDWSTGFQGDEAAFGQKGHDWFGAGEESPSNAVYVAVVATEETVITYKDEHSENTYTSKTLGQGMVVYGRLTGLVVTSGNVIAYRGDFQPDCR